LNAAKPVAKSTWLFVRSPEAEASYVVLFWSLRQRSDANTRGFYHNEVTQELVAVERNDLNNDVSLGSVREAIQFQQDDATNAKALADDQFAEVAILGDQNAVLDVRSFENASVGRA
jgi:hypothetical protein